MMRRFFKTLKTILEIFLVWQLALRLLRRYFKFPIPSFMGRVLDSNFRRAMQPPRLIIERSGIQPGMKVLEIGPGSGAFTTHVARAVGKNGKVYALDIQPEMLAMLQAKLDLPENQDIRNIELVNKSAYELPFEFSSLDLVYMITALQEIPDKQRTLKEIMRVLKPEGYLAITEFLPDPDYPWIGTTARMGLQAGFVIDGLEGDLWNYTVRFKKP